MLEKRDRKYYKQLAICFLAMSVPLLAGAFVAGISAEWHTATFHLLVPYWAAFPLIAMGGCLWMAARTGKRWPLGVWFPFFFLSLGAITFYLIYMNFEKAYLLDRFPCYVQTNYYQDKTRCMCTGQDYDTGYLIVTGPSTIDRCVRALNIAAIAANISYAVLCFAVVPLFLSFILVCNDLCCISCRRASSMPQVIVTGGQPGVPQQAIEVQRQVITYRTDEQPGSSSGAAPATGAGPLPKKQQLLQQPPPGQVPHSF